MLDGFRIKRLDVVDGEFTRMRVQEHDRMYMCTGKVGSYASCKIHVEEDSALAAVSLIMKNDITPPTVQSYIGSTNDKKIPSVIACAYHRNATGFKPPCVYPVSYGVKDYQFKTERFYEHAKSMLVAFMSPIIDACYVPTDCAENEEVCIEERITKILTDVDMPEEYIQYTQEFIELLIPHDEAHKCVPVDMDEVYDRQNRPAQRRLIDEGAFYGPDLAKKREINPFMKAEAHAEVKPPRNISVINPSDKINYSCYIYALSELFKKNAPWYAFGKTPVEIARRVSQVCSGAQTHCANSDLSRFDGRLSAAFRYLERVFLLRAFDCSGDLASKIVDLHSSQFGLRGRGKYGTSYDSGFSRLSGSPETALFNSLANAFIVYVTFRKCNVSKLASWSRLGIYGGDDGLTADLHIAKYIEVAASLGMKTTTEKVAKGELGIKFLARMYSPDVWNGSLASCCDMKRQLSKFHATTKLPSNVTCDLKLIEKARGFFLSDHNTPVIGELARKVMQLTTVSSNGDEVVSSYLNAGEDLVFDSGTMANIAARPVIDDYSSRLVRNYASLADPKDQYPNEDSGWMEDLLLREIPTFSFSRLRDHLARVTTLTELRSCPLCAEPERPKTSVPVIVQEERVEPPPEPSPAQEVASPSAPDKGKGPEVDPSPRDDPHTSHPWRDRATCRKCHPPTGQAGPGLGGGVVEKGGRSGGNSGVGPSAHAGHKWDNPRTCYQCHPELRPAPTAAQHAEHKWKDMATCFKCHPRLFDKLIPRGNTSESDPPNDSLRKPGTGIPHDKKNSRDWSQVVKGGKHSPGKPRGPPS
jgi:hypothetical protein